MDDLSSKIIDSRIANAWTEEEPFELQPGVTAIVPFMTLQLSSNLLIKFPLGPHVMIGVPEGYDSDPDYVRAARERGAGISVHRDAREAVSGADVVVTETWISMGQAHAEAKLAAMAPFQVNTALMGAAKEDAIFLHCLPAHRNEEVTDAVIDSAQSVVWDEAENRIHAQKSVLRWVFGQL